MAVKPKRLQVPEPASEPKLTEEEKLILQGMELREKLDRLKLDPKVAEFHAVESLYDKTRKALVGIHKTGLASGRNAPMTAPGVLVTWRPKDMPAMDARTDYLISFNRLVAPVA